MLRMNEVIKLVVERIKNNHHSLRNAFLELDKVGHFNNIILSVIKSFSVVIYLKKIVK